MFDWSAYLRLADDLAKNKESEAELRSAVSRAYYAAYHAAKTYVAEVRPGASVAGDSHEAVWKALQTNPPGTRPSEGRVRNDGFRLRDYRVSADYKAQAGRFDQMVIDALRLARRIVADLEALRRAFLRGS